jgi:hypothetical protein
VWRWYFIILILADFSSCYCNTESTTITVKKHQELPPPLLVTERATHSTNSKQGIRLRDSAKQILVHQSAARSHSEHHPKNMRNARSFVWNALEIKRPIKTKRES